MNLRVIYAGRRQWSRQTREPKRAFRYCLLLIGNKQNNTKQGACYGHEMKHFTFLEYRETRKYTLNKVYLNVKTVLTTHTQYVTQLPTLGIPTNPPSTITYP